MFPLENGYAVDSAPFKARSPSKLYSGTNPKYLFTKNVYSRTITISDLVAFIFRYLLIIR